MSDARIKRLEHAQIQTMFHAQFFAAGVARLPVEFDDRYATAATDGKRILWNRSFFDSLPDAVLPTVLCHEVAHCMLGHLWRMPAGGDHDVWNQAVDHAVNLMLKEFSALTTAQNKADPFPFPQPEKNYCADPQFAGMAEESIYARLMSNRPPGTGQGKPRVGKASGEDSGVQGGGRPSLGSMSSLGDVIPADVSELDSADAKRLKNEWDATLLQAAAAINDYGSLPGYLERFIRNLVTPSVPWVEVLRSLLREQCAGDWNWQSPALEFDASGFILPSLNAEKLGSVVFGSDWSGSTFVQLVNKFHAEKQSCLDNMRPRALVDVAFDTQVIQVREYAPGDTVDPSIKGGGGTDFRPFFAHCEALQPAPNCAVLLTDCDGPWPDLAPTYPVVIVTWDKSAKAPFGQVIYAE